MAIALRNAVVWKIVIWLKNILSPDSCFFSLFSLLFLFSLLRLFSFLSFLSLLLCELVIVVECFGQGALSHLGSVRDGIGSLQSPFESIVPQVLVNDLLYPLERLLDSHLHIAGLWDGLSFRSRGSPSPSQRGLLPPGGSWAR